jgi:hypothetical protein
MAHAAVITALQHQDVGNGLHLVVGCESHRARRREPRGFGFSDFHAATRSRSARRAARHRELDEMLGGGEEHAGAAHEMEWLWGRLRGASNGPHA